MQRIALTGPVGALEEWCEAARLAGWEPVALPLIDLHPRSCSGEECRALDEFGVPDWVALSSVHATPFFLELCAARAWLRTQPYVLVGQRAAEALRRAGMPAAHAVYPDAAHLLAGLAALPTRKMRLLWPRGDHSDELARNLRNMGARVHDPIAYENRPRKSVSWPAFEWAFFASPSAVEQWLALEQAPLGAAIAIGESTRAKLAGAASQRLSAIISLPEPTVNAFRRCLESLGKHPST